ncbi:tumor necrosis factor receptor superfamily member 4-like [Cataglyphis hispanica]|uniref:tumor necrosis factor receptor superfamily member 4-like n=1 Tax=Cataglyphis hispanica TaxID=1086592 RepID=UPI00217FDC67|nr:tumor necrosis factor receptor superfamily member 4-like [Cataglyphis hispanica]
MNNRRKPTHGRCVVLTIAIIACMLAVFIKTGEGKPHIRHHRDGSHCSRCGPGWGVISRCARGRDTVCGKCPAGTYSPHHGTQPCWNCARCGPGLYEAHPCTSRTDTVCDSCHRPMPDNPDYRRKCEGRARFFLAPEDARNTAEESVLVNEPAYRFQLNDREQILERDVEAILSDKSAARSKHLSRI